jgi:hypothetical protein
MGLAHRGASLPRIVRSRDALCVLAALTAPACSGTVAVEQGSGVASGTASSAQSSAGAGGASGSAATTGGSTSGPGGGSGGADACAPLSCEAQGFNCGPASDGCQGALDCGTCAPPGVCGSSGLPNVCGPCSTCVPSTCEEQAVQCGATSDGCGNPLDCGGCGPPPGCCEAVTSPTIFWSCGFGCEIASCADLGVSCGIVPDGCGESLDCGACTAPETCGGGGKHGVCGVGSCTPLTCADQGYQCGPAGDGCGGVLHCGSCDPCTPGCGENSSPGHCEAVLVSMCVPKTCAEVGYACGATGDGCGNALECGACPAGLTCAKGQCGPACM